MKKFLFFFAAAFLVSCDGEDGSGARTGQAGGPNSESGKPGGPAMQSRDKDDFTEASKPDSTAIGSSGNVPK